MIYYELNEDVHPNSKLPKEVIEKGELFPGLEQITGADFMIVPEQSNYEKVKALRKDDRSYFKIAELLNLELEKVIALDNKDIETVLFEWLLAGAVLVQRKSGFDFLNSMGDRLNHSISLMCEVAQKAHQRIVLVTGTFTHKNNDILYLDGVPTNYKWSSFVGALSSIKFKGCCAEFQPSDEDVSYWIQTQEKQLLKYKRENTKWIVKTVYYPPDMPELDDPLQLMRPVRDARLAMVNIPGWGSHKVNILQEYVQKCLKLQLASPSLYHLLHYATSPETAKYCNGIGRVLIKNARDYVGLADGEFLGVGKNNVTVQIEQNNE